MSSIIEISSAAIRTFAALLCGVMLLCIQRQLPAQGIGMGTEEAPLTARVHGDLIKHRIGADSFVALIILWRGQPFWDRATNGSSFGNRTGPVLIGSSGRAVGGSAMRQTLTRTRGGITRTTEYDPGNQILVIDSRDTVRTPADSTTIVMVDRIDGVGGAQFITSTIVPKVPAATVYTAPPVNIDRATYDSLIRAYIETGRVTNNLSRFLATIPVIAEFLRER